MEISDPPLVLESRSRLCYISGCSRLLDVVFLLDFSGSVDDTYSLVLNFIKHVVHGLEFSFDRTRVALATFSDRTDVKFHLNTYNNKYDVLNALAFRMTRGRTNTQEALRIARDDMFSSRNGDRSGVANKLIILTDGGSNMRSDQTLQRAVDLKNDGVTIYVVSIGQEIDYNEINGLSSGSSEPFVLRLEGDMNNGEPLGDLLLDDLCQ